MHTTQFAIRDPKIGLFEPVLALAAEEMNRATRPLVRIGGVCGATKQAVSEAETLRQLGYHSGLLSLAALRNATEAELLAHCRAVAAVIPVVGFYLQTAVGGRALPYSFWRQFAEIENVVAIKIAPFNRYQTFDVVRAVAESGRDDLALYTGNDDKLFPTCSRRSASAAKRCGSSEACSVTGQCGPDARWSCWRSVETRRPARSGCSAAWR